ncbi:MAG: hypothetical protein ACREUK_11325 [Burkholderiales bacterium]
MRIIVSLFAFAALVAPAVADAGCTFAWTCSSSGCASVMGSGSGTAGPFGSKSVCEQARSNYGAQGVGAGICNCGGAPGGASAAQPAAPATSEGEAFAQGFNQMAKVGSFNTPNQAAQTVGFGMANGFVNALMFDATHGPSPQELAQREAARQAQLRRQQDAAERQRLEEDAKYRNLVASLHGYQPSTGAPALKVGGNDPVARQPGDLALLKLGGADATLPLTPFAAGGVPPQQGLGDGNLGLLKLGDPCAGGAAAQAGCASGHGGLAANAESATGASAEAGQMFDTLGSRVAPPADVVVVPASPAASPVSAPERPNPKLVELERQRDENIAQQAKVQKEIDELKTLPTPENLKKIADKKVELGKIEQKQDYLDFSINEENAKPAAAPVDTAGATGAAAPTDAAATSAPATTDGAR